MSIGAGGWGMPRIKAKSRDSQLFANCIFITLYQHRLACNRQQAKCLQWADVSRGGSAATFEDRPCFPIPSVLGFGEILGKPHIFRTRRVSDPGAELSFD